MLGRAEKTLANDVLQTILDRLPCGVSLFDVELNLLAHNNEFLRLLEFPADLGSGGKVTFETFVRYNVKRGEYGPGEPEELVRVIVERAKRMEPHVVERARPNGTVIEVRGMPLPEGGFITLYTDITQRKHAEEELRKAKDALEQLALQDPLTGLPNRRRFTIGFEHEAVRRQRTGAPLSLLMLDIDHFKAVNDRDGHLAGDVCLKDVANVLRASARDADLVARFGGEEFIVLLPETTAAQALVVAERMRCKVQSETSVTISIGAATAEAGPPTLDGMVRQADEATYRAKRSGRNRVCA